LNSLSPLESKIIALLKVILNCLFSSVKWYIKQNI
jgi:hypothetical protein